MPSATPTAQHPADHPAAWLAHKVITQQEDRRVEYLPTCTEIADACAQIRSGWTTGEMRRRFVGETPPDESLLDWHPPVIDTSCFRLNMGGVSEGV